MAVGQTKKVEFRSKTDSYTVTIGRSILPGIGEIIPLQRFTKIGVVADEHVCKFWLNQLQSGIARAVDVFTIPRGERAKDIATLQSLWREFNRRGFDRDSLVLCLGGAATTDIGGFAAATFMRGIAFAHIPTSLLAQVDGAIGSKVGLNFDGAKNLVGAFASPLAVICDVDTVSSLDIRERRSGLAEMIKHALAFDSNYARALANFDKKCEPSQELVDLVARSVELKAAVVCTDKLEKGLRRLLNLGHTIGHVVETMSLETGRPLAHGEAVAIGLVAEARMAELAGLLTKEHLNEAERLLLQFELPVRLEVALPEDVIMQRITRDKKASGGITRWPLLTGIGSNKLDVELASEIVRQGIQYVACS